MEDEQEEQQSQNPQSTNNRKKTPMVIGIPSYQEVIESSQAKSTPPSLYNPSQSYTQAFSFPKSFEFYAPPPPSVAPSASTLQSLHPSQSAPSSQAGQSNVPSSSSSALGTALAAAVGSLSLSYSQSRNAILVSHRQGNPLLKHIINVRWTFADIDSDYMLGQNSCALYLSLRYHLLHPDYLYYHIRELQKNFKLRVVLCHVDVEDVVKPLLEVTKTALLHDCTLLCGWSLEECGRYLETIKVYENKSAELIQGQMDTDYLSRLNHALTTVRHVNKTDVVTLGSTFGSLCHIMDASMEDLAHCPGIGERKVKRLYDTFHEPFKHVNSSHPAFPETPVQKDEHCSVSEVTQVEDTEDASKRQKKEPEVSVKSALSTTFAKYASKISKKDYKSHDKKEEENCGDMGSEAETRKSSEGTAN